MSCLDEGKSTGGTTTAALLADLFESFVGAIYLDQGLEP